MYECPFELGVRAGLRRGLAQSHQVKYEGEIARDLGTGGYASIPWEPIELYMRLGSDRPRRAARLGRDRKIVSVYQ